MAAEAAADFSTSPEVRIQHPVGVVPDKREVTAEAVIDKTLGKDFPVGLDDYSTHSFIRAEVCGESTSGAEAFVERTIRVVASQGEVSAWKVTGSPCGNNLSIL